MNFEENIREAVLAKIDCWPEAQTELREKSAAHLLIIYFNWLNRLVAPTPRKVHHSRELDETVPSLDDDLRRALDKIVADIQGGRNLRPYLSRGIQDVYVEKSRRPPKLKARQDLDLLLNAWGVHHLHLSTVPGSDSFVARAKCLVFVAFTKTDAFLIDVMPHGNWHRRHLLEVMVRNWPDAGLVLGSISGARLVRQLSEVEGKELREAGVALFEEIDGRLCMPRDSVTIAGTSMQATRRSNQLMYTIDEFQRGLATDPDHLNRQFDDQVDFPPVCRWRFVFVDEGCALREEHTRATILLE